MKDPIERQAAIEAFDCCDLTSDGGIDANDAIDILKQLPPAQPDLDRIYAELSKAYNVEGLPDEAIGIIGDLMLSLELPSVQPEIVRCKDCRFCHKSPDWKHLQSFGLSIWCCGKSRGLNSAEVVELDDYCSSAERRTDG